MEPARYLALYAAALPAAKPRARRAAGRLPPLGRRNFHLRRGPVDSTPLTLPQLFTAGVECGHTEARVELKHRIGT